MRENALKKIWARGEAVVNGWLSIPSGFSAEVMAHQGFDSLTIDMQHGVVDYQVAVSMLQGISTLGVVPLARVPWNDPARLMKILDAGVYGVICPMINTREEAEALVRQPVEGVFRYEPEAVEKILAASALKPYVIQKFCIHAVNHMLEDDRTTITADDVEAVREAVRFEGRDESRPAVQDRASA